MISMGYAKSLIEVAKNKYFTRHDAEYFFPTDDKASEVFVKLLSKETGIPVLHNYNKATTKTIVFKAFIDKDMRYEYPGVKVFGLIAKKGVKHDFAVLTGCKDDVQFITEED